MKTTHKLSLKSKLIISPLVNLKWIEGEMYCVSPLTGEIFNISSDSLDVMRLFNQPAVVSSVLDSQEGKNKKIMLNIIEDLFKIGNLTDWNIHKDLKFLFHKGDYQGRIEIMAQGHLYKWGFHRSLKESKPVDSNGLPIPWMGYPVIAYFEHLDLKNKTVFEYGSGYSSLYWSRKAKSVVTVETEKEWAVNIKKMAPKNLKVLHREKTPDFANAILDEDTQYDVVVIDGMPRTREASLKQALKGLAPGGILVLDDSNHYPKNVAQLMKMGFTRVDFFGLCAAEPAVVQITSVFFLGTCTIPMKMPLSPKTPLLDHPFRKK